MSEYYDTEDELRRKLKKLKDEKDDLERENARLRYERERGSFGGWNDE